jgi:hypothetical protein
VALCTFTMLYNCYCCLFSELFHHTKQKLFCSLSNTSSIPPYPPVPANFCSTFCLNKCAYFGFFIQVKLFNICPVVPVLFYLVQGFEGSFVLQYIAEFHPFLRINSIFIYTWASSIFWLLWMLLWTLVYKYLLECVLSVLLYMFLGVEFYIIWYIYVQLFEE